MWCIPLSDICDVCGFLRVIQSPLALSLNWHQFFRVNLKTFSRVFHAMFVFCSWCCLLGQSIVELRWSGSQRGTWTSAKTNHVNRHQRARERNNSVEDCNERQAAYERNDILIVYFVVSLTSSVVWDFPFRLSRVCLLHVSTYFQHQYSKTEKVYYSGFKWVVRTDYENAITVLSESLGDAEMSSHQALTVDWSVICTVTCWANFAETVRPTNKLIFSIRRACQLIMCSRVLMWRILPI